MDKNGQCVRIESVAVRVIFYLYGYRIRIMNPISFLKQLIKDVQQGDYSIEYSKASDDSVTRNKRYAKFYQKVLAARTILFSQQCLEIADRHQIDGTLRKALTWYMRVLVNKTHLELAHQFYHNYGVCLTKLEMYDRAMEMFFEVRIIKTSLNNIKETRTVLKTYCRHC